MSLVRRQMYSSNYSQIALVGRSSRRRVRAGLESVGAEIVKLTLAWACLKEVKEAGGINLNLPAPAEYDAIADRYNQLRWQLPLPASRNPAVNGDTIAEWLKLIGHAIENS